MLYLAAGILYLQCMCNESSAGLRVCVLASGSSGNCVYVASAETAILIDAGLSYRETVRRLEQVGPAPADIAAICVTHEHDDHKTSLGVFQRKTGVELYANSGTIEGLERNGKLGQVRWNVFTTGRPFPVGDLLIEPFSVPHDAYEPVGFVVTHGTSRVGIVTDMGVATGLARERLRTCEAVVIESNHDVDLLRSAHRPWSLKQRILGRQGHLSNEQAGRLLADIAGDGLKVAFLAHLSADCNEPDLALRTVNSVLENEGHMNVAVKLTYAERVSEIVLA